VVRAAGDTEIVSSDVPDIDLSEELQTYPEDRLRSLLDQRRASFSFRPGDRLAGPPPLDGSGGSDLPTDGFAALVTRTDLGPLAVVSLLAVAVGFGAVHVLGPGRSKTIMAAYLVGTRGRARDRCCSAPSSRSCTRPASSSSAWCWCASTAPSPPKRPTRC
jgi:nickel/cobalt exporter